MKKHTVRSLGEPIYTSPICKLAEYVPNYTEETEYILEKLTSSVLEDEDPVLFEKAKFTSKVFFEPGKTKVGIVTCGGLCPGLNDIIHNIVITMHYWFKIKDIVGFKYGYAGIGKTPPFPPIELTPDNVSNIHETGGTILGSSRGTPPTPEIVDTLERLSIDILFCIGGDGTLRGANEIAEEVNRRGLKKSIIGIPKTIDNDIYCVEQSFGFQTAVKEAQKVLDCAHIEAKGALNGVGLVKLMGRDAGFVAASATKASGNVNYCLVPEVEFPLHGENGLLEHLRERLKKKPHAVIAVSEGAGVHLIGKSGEKDASGNVLHNDIGRYLKAEISKQFAEWGETVNVKYFSPSYSIRSVPADSEDSIFCTDFARAAVCAAMAGKTAMLIGYMHGEFVNIPFEVINGKKKSIHDDFKTWLTTVASTGQPVEWGRGN